MAALLSRAAPLCQLMALLSGSTALFFGGQRIIYLTRRCCSLASVVASGSHISRGAALWWSVALTSSVVRAVLAITSPVALISSVLPTHSAVASISPMAQLSSHPVVELLSSDSSSPQSIYTSRICK